MGVSEELREAKARRTAWEQAKKDKIIGEFLMDLAAIYLPNEKRKINSAKKIPGVLTMVGKGAREVLKNPKK